MTALTALTGGDLAAWIRLAAETVSAHTDELTALDAAIGDADHGANMRRGMDAAASAVDDLEAGGAAPAPDVVLKKVAMTLISTIGGASGPLYGTFFLRASTACAGVEALDTPTLATAVEAGVAFVPGADFFPRGGGENHMRLNFSNAGPDMIRDGIARLAAICTRATQTR